MPQITLMYKTLSLLQVQCDVCDGWVHVTCSDVDYDKLSESMKFSCLECSNNVEIQFVIKTDYHTL